MSELPDLIARFGATGGFGVLRPGEALDDVEKVLGPATPNPGVPEGVAAHALHRAARGRDRGDRSAAVWGVAD